MRSGIRGGLLLLVYFVLLLLPSGMSPLVETTEARYGEIAREMIVTGDYLVPRFNGVKHFHKPPLAYWLVAGGMKIFGQNDFGARFFSMVAAILAVWFFQRLARLLLGAEKKALAASLIFSTSLLFLAVARIASTEIYLTCFTLAAQYYLFRQLYGARTPANAILYSLFLGLGFLTKGPIIFLFTLLPFFIAKIVDSDHRAVFSGKEILIGLGVFLAIALPWYLVVVAENPGLLTYFLKVQTVDRVVTDRFRRYEPPWYFFYIFLGTFLPWTFFFLWGLVKTKTFPRRVRILLLYLVVPFIVFTVAKGKHATYILPLYGMAALFTAEAFFRFAMPLGRFLTLVLVTLMGAAPAVAGFLLPELADYRVPLGVASGLGLAVAWGVFRALRSERFLAWVSVGIVLFSVTGYAAFAKVTHHRRGYERLVDHLNQLDPQRQLPPSVSFYRGQLAVMALGAPREVQFQDDGSYRLYYLDTDRDVTDYLADHPALFVVLHPGEIGRFTLQHPLDCNEVYSQRKAAAYLCREPHAPQETAPQP